MQVADNAGADTDPPEYYVHVYVVGGGPGKNNSQRKESDHGKQNGQTCALFYSPQDGGRNKQLQQVHQNAQCDLYDSQNQNAFADSDCQPCHVLYIAYDPVLRDFGVVHMCFLLKRIHGYAVFICLQFNRKIEKVYKSGMNCTLTGMNCYWGSRISVVKAPSSLFRLM